MQDEDDPRQSDDTPEENDADADQAPEPSEPADGSPPPVAFQAFSKRYSKMFSDMYSPAMKHFAANLAPHLANLFPNVRIAGLLPPVKLPTVRIDPAALGVGKTIAEIIQKQQAPFSPFAKILEQQRKQWDSLFDSLRTLREALFPLNWKGVTHPDFDVIEAIVLDEGIPLAWIPGSDTLQAVFDAPNAAKRRQILGRRWKRVVADCETALGEVSHPDLQLHLPFADDIVRALRDGHVSAAQALAANLLDSVLRRNFDQKSFKKVTTNKKGGDRFDLDAYQIRVAFTLGPIWRAYGEYWESQGDPIPRTFGRHPSAHAVSRAQYSRINAVVALMLVTSLLRLLDTELTR